MNPKNYPCFIAPDKLADPSIRIISGRMSYDVALEV